MSFPMAIRAKLTATASPREQCQTVYEAPSSSVAVDATIRPSGPISSGRSSRLRSIRVACLAPAAMTYSAQGPSPAGHPRAHGLPIRTALRRGRAPAATGGGNASPTDQHRNSSPGREKSPGAPAPSASAGASAPVPVPSPASPSAATSASNAAFGASQPPLSPPESVRSSSPQRRPASELDDQPSEAGFVDPSLLAPAAALAAGGKPGARRSSSPSAAAAAALDGPAAAAGAGAEALVTPANPASEDVRQSWDLLRRWSKFLSQTRGKKNKALDKAEKVVVFGGGSFGTAMACVVARNKPSLEVVMLLRDPYLAKDINEDHRNTRYLPDFVLPPNVRATTSAAEAILGAQYAVHAVPVQSSRAFLQAIAPLLPANVPVVCVSKGLEVSTGKMMSEVIPEGLGRKQPAAFLSGPSFAKEVMEGRPTVVVVASKDRATSRIFQQLFASQSLRVSTTKDVVGVEIAGALKNVLAIAAGIVDGMELGHNALAALVAQGCTEIRWLAERMGADPRTLSGVSGLGDIMLTCYVNLSRNRTVGRRLGAGEALKDIVSSSSQIAEGVSTAGAVVRLARQYRVSLPVLTAVAQICDNQLSPREAVYEIMALPQVEEV